MRGVLNRMDAKRRMQKPTHSRLLLRPLAVVTMVSLLTVALAGCGPDPKATVHQFYTALQKGDFENAATCMEGPVPEPLEFGESEEAEEIARSVFARLTFVLGKETKVSGEVATVQATVTGPDLVRILIKAMGEVMPIIFGAAFGSEADQLAAQAKVESIMKNAFSAADAPMVTSEITLKLHKVGGKWLIAEGENPLSFMTEGLEELGELFMPQ
jgi:hypothetical protein